MQYWQGLNEPNLSLFFNPQFDGDSPVSPDLYRTLINSFYAAVKAVDPSNLVIAAGLGPIAVPKYTIGPMRFTRLLLCMRGHKNPRPTRGDCEGGVHFDIFDIHPYTTGGPTHEGGHQRRPDGRLVKLRTLLDAADRAGRIKGMFEHTPLWIGEFSWDSNPPDPGGLAMNIETRWTAEAMYRAWRAGVGAFFWYSLRDRKPQPHLPFSSTLESGLYFRGATIEQDQPKEILFAFRFPFVSYPGKKGLFVWGRTPTAGRQSRDPDLEGRQMAQDIRGARQQERDLQRRTPAATDATSVASFAPSTKEGPPCPSRCGQARTSRSRLSGSPAAGSTLPPMKIGIVGLGYVGLPLAVAFAEAGHEVVGLDADPRKVEALNEGRSYVEDIPDAALEPLRERLSATARHADLAPATR